MGLNSLLPDKCTFNPDTMKWILSEAGYKWDETVVLGDEFSIFTR